jgi:hypothetical protein
MASNLPDVLDVLSGETPLPPCVRSLSPRSCKLVPRYEYRFCTGADSTRPTFASRIRTLAKIERFFDLFGIFVVKQSLAVLFLKGRVEGGSLLLVLLCLLQLFTLAVEFFNLVRRGIGTRY